jgi:hypothetical protein
MATTKKKILLFNISQNTTPENSLIIVIIHQLEAFCIKDAAINARNALEDINSMNAVVFYDPVYNPSSDSNFFKDLFGIESNSKELLLDQVNDFIEWYKKEFVEGK